MNTKFEFVKDDTVTIAGVTLTRIRALRDIPEANVKAGDLGGYLESEKNLSECGNAWVFGEALVFGEARVFGEAWVFGEAQVFGEAKVFGEAWVFGEALVFGNARVSDDARVFGNARVSGEAQVFGDARVSGEALVFGEARVSGEALVSGDARVSGEALVSGDARISPICISGFGWIVTITDHHMRIGCQFHGIEVWDKFTDAEIAKMDGKDALRFWREHKDWLMMLARTHAKKAAAK